MTNTDTSPAAKSALLQQLLARLMQRTGWSEEKATRWLKDHFGGKLVSWKLILRELAKERGPRTPPTFTDRFTDQPDTEDEDDFSL